MSSPIEKAWKKTLPGHCIDIGILWYVNSVFTLLADLFLIVLPINQILRLKLPLSQKLGLVFVFSLGILYAFPISSVWGCSDGFRSVMACTIIRCVALGPTVSQKDSVCKSTSSPEASGSAQTSPRQLTDESCLKITKPNPIAGHSSRLTSRSSAPLSPF